MYKTFNIKDGNINFGMSVFSDFAVHSALIRSFSMGSNFPTCFPHFPDGTMRYHFLFQFCTGTLEYLGFTIVDAFNILSILSLFNCVLLLYGVALELTGKRVVAMLSAVFLFCRPSFTGIIHFIDQWPYASADAALQSILTNFDFIGRTPNEAWGLWNTNVYANQRHLALGISVVLIGLWFMKPLIRDFSLAWPTTELGEKMSFNDLLFNFLFTKEAWLPQNYFRAILIGLLVGGASFFNGSMVIDRKSTRLNSSH